MEKVTKQYIEKQYGYLMVYFTIPGWAKLFTIVDEADVYKFGSKDFGFEKEPHITICPNFDVKNTDPKKVLEDTKKLSKITIKIQTLSVFENDEFDVLKFEVKNPYLTKANQAFKKKYKTHQDFPEYNAHITLAYLNPGTGKKYNGMKLKEPAIFTSNKFVYSDIKGKFTLADYE